MRHLLVRIDAAGDEVAESRLRGLLVQTRDYILPDEASGTFIDLVCREPSGHGAFDAIGSDLALALAGDAIGPKRAVTTVLAKWRRFWSEVPATLLTNEERLGLFGEMWFLRFWLLEAIDVDDAVGAWRGPRGTRHDFERSQYSVEVKATQVLGSCVHRISGIEQLSPPETGPLFFLSLQVRAEGGATNSLPTLVNVCRERLIAAPEALSVFEATLAVAGYSDAHALDYAEPKWRIVGERLFKVDEHFPRMTPGLLSGGVPAGVSQITYAIDLSSYYDRAIARTPVDGREYLR